METVKAFVFVDALGWEQVEKYDFLKDLLPHRRKIEMQFGYSCTAIPTILTGKRPDEHGHLAFYDWAPGKSPFKKAPRACSPPALEAYKETVWLHRLLPALRCACRASSEARLL